jgi:hypothetical protein
MRITYNKYKRFRFRKIAHRLGVFLNDNRDEEDDKSADTRVVLLYRGVYFYYNTAKPTLGPYMGKRDHSPAQNVIPSKSNGRRRRTPFTSDQGSPSQLETPASSTVSAWVHNSAREKSLSKFDWRVTVTSAFSKLRAP